MSLDRMTVGGRCGYAEPDDELGEIRCENMGVRITVQDPLGMRMSIVRCNEHSDWVEVREEDEHERI